MKLLLISLASMLFVSTASAAGFGVNLGGGVPYVGQGGLNYIMSEKLSFEVRYSTLAIEVDTAEVAMSYPEINVKWHALGGSFYLGLGVGQFSLDVEATDADTGLTASAEVSALAITPSLGWMWGISGGGFFMGLDLGYQMPQGADVEIKSDAGLLASSPEYKDVEESAENFAETALPVVTLLRIGYIF